MSVGGILNCLIADIFTTFQMFKLYWDNKKDLTEEKTPILILFF